MRWSQAGSVVIVRKSSNSRWKVGAFLSAEKYREVDVSTVIYTIGYDIENIAI